jgi:molybdopterin biosynthesis enzyme
LTRKATRHAATPILGESSGLSIPSRSDGFILGEPGVKQLESGTQVYVHYPPAL